MGTPLNQMLPAEIINQIFKWNYLSEYSIENYTKNKNNCKGYLINKYFTQQFFQNMLKDIDTHVILDNKDKGILQHSKMIKTLNCLYWEHELYEFLSLPMCFSNW